MFGAWSGAYALSSPLFGKLADKVMIIYFAENTFQKYYLFFMGLENSNIFSSEYFLNMISVIRFTVSHA